MVPFAIDMRAPELRTPYAERRTHVERCRGRKKLVLTIFSRRRNVIGALHEVVRATGRAHLMMAIIAEYVALEEKTSRDNVTRT